LRYLKKVAPGLSVTLSASRSSDIYQKVKEEELQVGVIVDSVSFTSKHLEKTHIYSDSFGVYKSNQLDADFNRQLIVFKDAVGSDEYLKDLKKNKMQNILEVQNLETVKTLAEEGVGVGILPHRVARESVLKGKLTIDHRFGSGFGEHSIVVVYAGGLKEAKEGRVLEELITYLDEWARV
jgi:DNA-binding transcriptional LysR family regulator